MLSKFKFLMFIVSILILGVIVWYANPYTVFLKLSKANLYFILLAFIVSNVAIFMHVLKWDVLLVDVSFKELFPIQIMGITISNFTPGKFSEPIKAAILKMKKGLPVSETLPSIVWERIIDVLVIIILSLFAIRLLTIKTDLFFIGIGGIMLFLALVCIFFLILYNKGFGFSLFRFFKKIPVFRGLEKKFLENFYKIKISPIKIFFSFILSSITWLLYGLVFYLSFLSLGVNLSPLFLSGLLALAIIIGILSSLPGGIGSTDAVMVLFLGVVGVDSTIAITGVLVARFLSLWYSILLGGLFFVFFSKKIDMKNLFK